MRSVATHQFKRDAGRGIVVAARIGYAARGVVYSVLGVLALMFAFGEGGKLTDGKGALERIGSLPFGDGMLWITSIGLACYALWCLVRAVVDPAGRRQGDKRILKRAGAALSCVVNASLSVYAGQLALGARSSGGNTKTYVAKLMSWPLGEILVAIVGAVTVGFGVYQIYKAVKNKVGDELSTRELSPDKQRLLCRIARIGVAGRGLVFPVIGGSLIIAALRSRPGEAEGFGDALKKLATQPYGDFLIAFVAAGLLAYGIYQLCIARYGRVPEPR